MARLSDPDGLGHPVPWNKQRMKTSRWGAASTSRVAMRCLSKRRHRARR